MSVQLNQVQSQLAPEDLLQSVVYRIERKVIIMATTTVTLELPTHLYTELQAIAMREQMDLIELIAHFVRQSHHHRTIQDDWKMLCELVQQQGGLQVGHSTEEIVERLRQTRQEIVEEEYAHLYR